MRSVLVTAAIAAGFCVSGALAQNGQDQASTPAGKSAGCGQMMSQMHCMMMGQMMTGQAETAKLVDELQKSLTAIEAAQNDPAVFKAKLAEHGELLKQLQAKVQDQSRMMDMMRHMMSGSMMGKGTAGGANTK